MNLDNVKKLKISKSPGIYKFLNKTGKIIYIGKAANLSVRVLSYWSKSASHTPAKYSMLKQINDIKCVETGSEIEALLLEANLIKKHQPQYNIVLRDDKRYIYIKVSIEEEIPGVFVVRKIDKSGRYFGPFVSVVAVRETLKAIRKIWPYCTARKRQTKPCFYCQINRCLGICSGLVDRKEYMKKVIRPIILFFEGKKKVLIDKLEVRIKKLKLSMGQLNAGSKEYDKIENKINELKYQLMNLRKVLENANIVGLEEKYAADVVELAKILCLPKVPQRIEGYDISNILGQQAVGSMAVFSGGEPDKKEYRKFKIKTGQDQANDVKMLKEVLERRFKKFPKGLKGEKAKAEWPLPDLIIIDGGKQQLSVALQVFKKFKISDKDIAVISISKGLGLRSASARDKIFFPKEKKPLELPLASPALHLIKRVRDEAHRFAINYHKQLRSKKFLNKS